MTSLSQISQGARPVSGPLPMVAAAPQTRFAVTRIDAVTPLDDQLGIDPKRGWPAALDLFFASDRGRHCYVLLDAAEGDGLTELLDGSGLDHVCLYQGAALYELGEVAPWLVRLEPGSSFARMLLTRGRSPASMWGGLVACICGPMPGWAICGPICGGGCGCRTHRARPIICASGTGG